MASNYTPNHSLCQWAAEDKVLRTEFNADNAKIDAALGSLSSSLSGKASSSAVSSLQSALDSLTQKVSQQTASIAKLGNCLLYVSSYTGSGSHNESTPTRLSFPHKPLVVFVSEGFYRLTLVQGSDSWCASVGTGGEVTATWSGNNVQWVSRYSFARMNDRKTYSVVALLDAEH